MTQPLVTRTRATTMEEYREIGNKLFAEHREIEFKPRSTDVIITPYSKSGTTWLQQIFHTLRTRGDMDFDDISRVVPWIEVSPGLGINLDAEQRANPRGFKSHLPYDKIPKGARYINSVRDPKDAAYSLFRFMEGWFIEPGTVSVDEFVLKQFLESRDYYHHLLTWWEQRNEEHVLFLAYEHIKADLRGTIRRIAEFCDLALDDELFDLTQEHASFKFMSQHNDRFDDELMRAKSEQSVLPSGSDSSKVRVGQIGEHKQAFSQDTVMALDAAWHEEITGRIGFKTYQELLAVI